MRTSTVFVLALSMALVQIRCLAAQEPTTASPITVTDGKAFLQNAVAAFGPVPVTTSQSVWFVCRGSSGGKPDMTECCCKTVSSTTNVPLSLTDTPSMVQNGDISYGALITHSSPDSVYADSVVVQNCLNQNISTVTDKTLSLSIAATGDVPIAVELRRADVAGMNVTRPS
jgi:hypothetical protein